MKVIKGEVVTNITREWTRNSVDKVDGKELLT